MESKAKEFGCQFFKDIFYAWSFGGFLLGSKKHEIPLLDQMERRI